MLLKIEGERGKAVENIHMRVHMGEKIHGKALRGLAELSVKRGGGDARDCECSCGVVVLGGTCGL